jgi:hypothetical protein
MGHVSSDQDEPGEDGGSISTGHLGSPEARPTEAQGRYLARGLTQPGGKLPLFEVDGREISKRTIAACMAHGWAEPWTHNPIRPDWLVCRLTAAGYRVLGATPPQVPPAGR